MRKNPRPPFIDAAIFTAADPVKTTAFYRALGLPLEEERHDDGPPHFACDVGGAHIAVYGAAKGRSRPARKHAAMLGFRVESLAKTLASLRRAGAKVLVEPQTVPWGRRAIVGDPDGRKVELNEAA